MCDVRELRECGGEVGFDVEGPDGCRPWGDGAPRRLGEVGCGDLQEERRRVRPFGLRACEFARVDLAEQAVRPDRGRANLTLADRLRAEVVDVPLMREPE